MQDLIKDTLGKLLTELQLEFSEITVDASDTSMIRVDIISVNPSRIIGWHGETLNALQHLVKSIARTKKKMEKAPFIIVDVDGYRRDQEQKVCGMAEQKIDFVRRKKTRVALPPMSPYFRRVVHVYIASHPDYQDITTESVGEGEYRQIVLRLKEGGMDEGEELQPVISKDEEKVVGFDNLDI
ncbi:hypothetical protein A3H16_02320 [Candidatus Kaiserbacteria bacterium RIFCSPLOWO2_12_FULL_53_8]|uniref:R3H domain-containing protein n=1 Tax=Candidatus Kaiserbacteria bacterium RIFCSPLOWO2_12_FULL_53_8 TaxID=1798529 RepID=A0A1F6FZK9_9BACT|nr:MAG: hypothetical protein A3H16_02320 [Candidatus Kaiserbacteria bacterium RIFCSPLOWO2_12_FULL_53_8]